MPARPRVDPAATHNAALMQDLSSKTATGAAWILGANVVQSLTRLVMAPILARLLSPETFGIAHMVLAVTFFVMTFADIGISSALVRDKTAPRSLWVSAFWLNLGIGLALAVLLLVLAWPAAALYQAPAIVPLMQASSAVLLFHALHFVPVARLQRAMNFGRIAAIDLVGSIVAAAGCIVMALAGAGVWSLIGYQMLFHGSRALGFWLISGFLPAWQFDVAEVRRVLSFSLHLLATRATGATADNVDRVIIGRALGAEALGYYGQAYQFMLMPMHFVVWGVVSTLIPAFSRIQDDIGRLGAAYLKCVRTLSLLLFPVFAGTSALAEPIVTVLLGTTGEWDWAPVAPILAILAPVGAVRCIISSQDPVLLAIGRADLLFRLSLAHMAAMLAGLLCGLPWGIQGVVTGFAVASFAVMLPMLNVTLRRIDLQQADLVRALLPFAAIAIGMALLVAGVDSLLVARGWSALWRLFLGVPLGAAAYGVAMLIFERELLGELLWLGREVIRGRGRGSVTEADPA